MDAVASAGIQGIDFRGLGEEIDITKLPQFTTDLPATLDLLRGRGLSMPCLNTSVTLISPDAKRWENMLDECHRYAQLAQRSGTRFLRIFGGGVPKELSHDEAKRMAHRHLRQLIKICGPLDCVPLVETHDEWATVPQLMELVGDFDPEETGVLWDIEHPVRKGEKPYDTAKGLGKYLRHAHVKDSVRADGKNIPKLLGEGDLPLADFVAALKEVHFDGWICLETEKRWHAIAPDPEESIPQFAEYMGKLISS